MKSIRFALSLILGLGLILVSCANPTGTDGGGSSPGDPADPELPVNFIVDIPGSLWDSQASASVVGKQFSAVAKSAQPQRAQSISNIYTSPSSEYLYLKDRLSAMQVDTTASLAAIACLEAAIRQNNIPPQPRTTTNPLLRTGYSVTFNQALHDKILALFQRIRAAGGSASGLPTVGSVSPVPGFYYFSETDGFNVRWLGVESLTSDAVPAPLSVYWNSAGDVKFKIGGDQAITLSNDAVHHSSALVLKFLDSGATSWMKLLLASDPSSSAHGLFVETTVQLKTEGYVAYSEDRGYADDNGGTMIETVGYFGDSGRGTSASQDAESFDGSGNFVGSSAYDAKLSTSVSFGNADSYAGSVRLFSKKTLSELNGDILAGNMYFVSPRELGTTIGSPIPNTDTQLSAGAMPKYSDDGNPVNVTSGNIGLGISLNPGNVTLFFPNSQDDVPFAGFVYRVQFNNASQTFTFTRLDALANHTF